MGPGLPGGSWGDRGRGAGACGPVWGPLVARFCVPDKNCAPNALSTLSSAATMTAFYRFWGRQPNQRCTKTIEKPMVFVHFKTTTKFGSNLYRVCCGSPFGGVLRPFLRPKTPPRPPQDPPKTPPRPPKTPPRPPKTPPRGLRGGGSAECGRSPLNIFVGTTEIWTCSKCPPRQKNNNNKA